MQRVTRPEYLKFLKENDLTDVPVESRTLSAMQSIDSNGVVQAQAVYSNGTYGTKSKIIPQYEIRKPNE